MHEMPFNGGHGNLFRTKKETKKTFCYMVFGQMILKT